MALSPDEIRVAFNVMRKFANDSGYGWAISDNQCQQVAVAVVTAVEHYRSGVAPPAAAPVAFGGMGAEVGETNGGAEDELPPS